MTPDHGRFLSELSEKERTLLILREELYEGSWKEMILDLSARLQKGPQVFELTETIEADLERIEDLAKALPEFARHPTATRAFAFRPAELRGEACPRLLSFSG